MAAGELSFAIRAVNEAKAALQSVQNDIDNLGGSASRAEPHASRLGGALSNIGQIASGFVIGQGVMQLPGFLMGSAQAAMEDAAATARLEQALRNASGSFDENLAKVNARIDSGQKLAYGDDAIRDSFQSLLAATGDVNEALSRQQVAMDLARGAGISLEQASKLVGKVNEDNIQAFKRMGIVIKDGATEAEALAAVQAKFAGQAQTYAASTAGQFDQAKIRMGELKEQLGTALLPAMTAVATALTTQVIPAIESFADKAGPKIKAFFGDVQRWWDENGKPALDNIIAAWEAIRPAVEPILNQIKTVVETAFRAIALAIGIVVDLLGGDFSGAWDKTKELVSTIVNSWKDSLNNGLEAIKGLFTVVYSIGKDIIGWLWTGTIEKGAELLGWFGELPQRVLDTIGDLSKLLYNAGKALIQGFIDGIQSMIGALTGVLSGITDKIPHLKGPIEFDRQMLVPNGQAVMDGFIGGITSRVPALVATLGMVSGIVGGTPGAAPWHPAVGGNAGMPSNRAQFNARLGWWTPGMPGTPSDPQAWWLYPGFSGIPTDEWWVNNDTRGAVGPAADPWWGWKEKTPTVVNVTVNLPNYLGDKSEIVDVLERELRLRFA